MRSTNSVRVQVSLPNRLAEKVKQKAEELGLSMSGTVVMLVSQSLQAEDAIKGMSGLVDVLSKVKQEDNTD